MSRFPSFAQKLLIPALLLHSFPAWITQFKEVKSVRIFCFCFFVFCLPLYFLYAVLSLYNKTHFNENMLITAPLILTKNCLVSSDSLYREGDYCTTFYMSGTGGGPVGSGSSWCAGVTRGFNFGMKDSPCVLISFFFDVPGVWIYLWSHKSTFWNKSWCSLQGGHQPPGKNYFFLFWICKSYKQYAKLMYSCFKSKIFHNFPMNSVPKLIIK